MTMEEIKKLREHFEWLGENRIVTICDTALFYADNAHILKVENDKLKAAVERLKLKSVECQDLLKMAWTMRGIKPTESCSKGDIDEKKEEGT